MFDSKQSKYSMHKMTAVKFVRDLGLVKAPVPLQNDTYPKSANKPILEYSRHGPFFRWKSFSTVCHSLYSQSPWLAVRSLDL